MNCDCLKFNEQKLIEHYAAKGVANPKVSPDFLGIDFQTGQGCISLVYTVRGDNRPYNTQKGKACHFVASYCPFCGKSAKAQAEQVQL